MIGIDIDVLHSEPLAVAIEALAKRMLGDTPAVRIRRAPKRLLVYRAAQPFKGFKYPPIEVLGLGQQFLAYGIHPIGQTLSLACADAGRYEHRGVTGDHRGAGAGLPRKHI